MGRPRPAGAGLLVANDRAPRRGDPGIERTRAPATRTSSRSNELDWARAQRADPGRYPEGPRTPGAHLVGAARDRGDRRGAITELKHARRVVDFDDLLELRYGEMDRDPAFAAQVRWRFRHFFVDEFQDVNPLQHALLEAWRGGRPDLCVVGDPRQAIYGWNGADPGC